MVLYLRAYAVWGGNKKILALLATTYIVSHVLKIFALDELTYPVQASFGGSAYTLRLYIKGSSVPGSLSFLRQLAVDHNNSVNRDPSGGWMHLPDNRQQHILRHDRTRNSGYL